VNDAGNGCVALGPLTEACSTFTAKGDCEYAEPSQYCYWVDAGEDTTEGCFNKECSALTNYLACSADNARSPTKSAIACRLNLAGDACVDIGDLTAACDSFKTEADCKAIEPARYCHWDTSVTAPSGKCFEKKCADIDYYKACTGTNARSPTKGLSACILDEAGILCEDLRPKAACSAFTTSNTCKSIVQSLYC
jgi:Paramecium surface antigen domain